MIFALHAYSLLRDTLYSTIKKDNSTISKKTDHHEPIVYSIPEKMNASAVLDEDGVKFSPPAYLQRYGDVCDKIQSDTRWAGQINKVVDFGCAELSLFSFLKRIGEINEVLAVDFDGELLERFCHRIKPLLYDYRIERTTPLNVSLLQGSVADPDKRLVGCDAVICIELIEHLDPATLDRFPQNIFGFIKPHLAFVTTPNVEFNVLFPKLKDGGFRHYDHRFEWTRSQFEEWANNIVLRYPDYDVEFYGIAAGPDGTEHLGCCSQMALFISKNYQKDESHTYVKTAEYDPKCTENSVLQVECSNQMLEPKSSTDDDMSPLLPLDSSNKPVVVWDWTNWENDLDKEYYKLIAHHVYPFTVDSRSRDQIILDEAISSFNLLVGYDYDYFDESTEEWKVPLVRLLPRLKGTPVDIEELRRVILKSGRRVKDDYLLFESGQSNSSEEDDLNCSENDDTTVDYKQQWTNLWVDEPLWVEDPPSPEIAADTPSKKQEEKYELSDYVVENASIHSHEMSPNCIALNHQTGIYTSLEMSVESATGDICILGSSNEDGSLLNSPLARFYGPNGSSADEQRLSDSGYLKSQQDSPQSPVCSDTFSNDLITPDKDYLEMQSTMLECIPENLNCLSSTSKDVTRLRRKSIGPGIDSKYPEFNNGESSATAMSRPKSLNMCTTSPKSDIDDSKRPNSVGSSRKHSDQQSCDEFKPWSPVSYKLNNIQPDMIDMSPIDDGIEDAPMRQLLDLDPRNIDRRVADGFRMPNRLIRPDFLDVQNVDFAVFQNGDRLNNNLDFEGNNFEGGEDADEFRFREGNIFHGEYMGDDHELLRLHLDRHNENHLILDQEIDRLVNEINHEIDHREIVENILEYQENDEANENDGFYNGPSNDDIIKGFPESSPISNVAQMSPEIGMALKINHKLHQTKDVSKTNSDISNQEDVKKLSLMRTMPSSDFDNMKNIVNFQAGCSNYADNDYGLSFDNPSEFYMLRSNGMTRLVGESNSKTDCNTSENDCHSLSEVFINDVDEYKSLTNIWENKSNSYDALNAIENYDEIPCCSFVNRHVDNVQDIDLKLSSADNNEKKDPAILSLSHTNDVDERQQVAVPPAIPPFNGPVEEPTEWGAFGDGPGVHSITASTSSGNSSGSVGDDVQIELLDLFWVSSGGSASNSSTPAHRNNYNHRRLYDESSSSVSDTPNGSRFPSTSTPLSGSSTQDASTAPGSTHSSQVDLGISLTQSDGSGNVADIEVDSQSD